MSRTDVPKSRTLQLLQTQWQTAITDATTPVIEPLQHLERIRAAINEQGPALQRSGAAELHQFCADFLHVPFPELRQKYVDLGDADFLEMSQRKAKEFQLQAVLRLHQASLSAQGAGEATVDPIAPAVLEEVVQLLEVVAFSSASMDIGGFQIALHGILGYFAAALPQTVLAIYEALEIRPPPGLLPNQPEPEEDDLLALLGDAGMDSDGDNDPCSQLSASQPRPVSPASAPSSAPLHPLLSRARSFSAYSSDPEAELGSGSQSLEALDDGPPRKRSPCDAITAARRVLQSISAPNTAPQSVDLSSARTMSDPLGRGGSVLLCGSKPKTANPPLRLPARKPPLKKGASSRAPFRLIASLNQPSAPILPDPASPPQAKVRPPWQTLGSRAPAPEPPMSPGLRRLLLAGAQPAPGASPARLTVEETPPRGTALSRLALLEEDEGACAAKMVIYESD